MSSGTIRQCGKPLVTDPVKHARQLRRIQARDTRNAKKAEVKK